MIALEHGPRAEYVVPLGELESAMTENSLIAINVYAIWLTELKQRIQSAQQRTTCGDS